MVSIISTTQDSYKGFWSSPIVDSFMDHSKPERSASRHPYPAPLTDPTTSLQSYYASDWSIPSQPPLELKLPEKGISRKRKASDDDELDMSQPFQRPRRDDATIDPQSLTAPFTTSSYAPPQYVPTAPTTTSPYSTYQPTPSLRTTPAPAPLELVTNQLPYAYVESSPSVPSSYPSQRSSITSTGSQSMAPFYGNSQSFQPAYPQTGYPQASYAPPNYPNMPYASPPYTSPTYTSPATYTSPQQPPQMGYHK